MLGDGISVGKVNGFTQVVGRDIRNLRERIEHGIHCGDGGNSGRFIHIDVCLKPVARRDNDGTGNGGVGRTHKLG